MAVVVGGGGHGGQRLFHLWPPDVPWGPRGALGGLRRSGVLGIAAATRAVRQRGSLGPCGGVQYRALAGANGSSLLPGEGVPVEM